MSDILKRINELLKMPQHLCKMCGKCCRVVNFKGGLSCEEVKELAQSISADPSQVEGARDFLAIFVPYESVEEANKVSPESVKLAKNTFGKDTKASFFCCKYLTEDNKCLIHEDRPTLCRTYPVPHSGTLYNPECGFKELGTKNWQEIADILEDLKRQKRELEERQEKCQQVRKLNKSE